MLTRKNARLIYHKDVNQLYLSVEDEDGKVTLWDASGLKFISRHASLDTAFTEAGRRIGQERFTKFYNEQQLKA